MDIIRECDNIRGIVHEFAVRHQISYQDVCDSIGADFTQFVKWMNGKDDAISQDDLIKILYEMGLSVTVTAEPVNMKALREHWKK